MFIECTLDKIISRVKKHGFNKITFSRDLTSQQVNPVDPTTTQQF
jgi:hypothetical protein